jgi:hypothetical protein
MSFFSALFGEKKPTDCSEKKVIMDKAKEDYDQCQKKLENPPQQPTQQPTQQPQQPPLSTTGGKKSRKSKSKRTKKTKRTKKSKTQKRH